MEVPGSGADCGNDVWTIETEAGVSIPGHCKRSEENNFNRSCCAREGKLHTDCNVNWTSGSLDLREGCRQGLKDPKKGWGSKRPAECSLGNCVTNGAKQPVPSAHSAESKWKLGLGWIDPNIQHPWHTTLYLNCVFFLWAKLQCHRCAKRQKGKRFYRMEKSELKFINRSLWGLFISLNSHLCHYKSNSQTNLATNLHSVKEILGINALWK